MRISVRSAVGGSSDVVEKNVVAGRTLVRLADGQRLEIVDEKTGRVPADLQARRGGPDGQDLILSSDGEIVEVQGFFAMAAEGEDAVAVAFPGGAVAQITPASAELAAVEWTSGSAYALPEGGAASMMAQAAPAATAGTSAAGGAAAGGSAAGIASSMGWGWWAIGGLAAAGAGVAIANNDDDDAPPPPAPEPAPTFTLSASTEAVDEGADAVFTLSTTNVAAGTQYEYEISGVSASDLVGGKLTGTVTIDANGQALIPVSLVEDLKTEGVETLKVTIAGQSVEVTVNDTSPTPEPTFDLSASAETVDEGADVVFTLSTTHVAPGTQFDYQISGVSSADIAGGKLTGTVTIDPSGRAVIPVSLLEDLKSEGVETLKITIAGETYEVAVKDVSVDPEPTFALSASTKVVDEGADVVFTLSTTQIEPGTTYSYTISGVSAQDVVGGQLTGTVTIGANGQALIPVSLVADRLTEGQETLTITIAGQVYEVSVKDTSTTPTLLLTPDVDVLAGSAADDVVHGSSATYNAGDKIDGGAGHDRLDLVLDDSAQTSGVEVRDVEQVDLQAVGTGEARLDMARYDGFVAQINIDNSTADVRIDNQQSLADVSITNSDLGSVTLDYAADVVASYADTLNLSIANVSDDDAAATIDIDSGIEAIDLQVGGAADESSHVGLDAAGVTDLTVTGGQAGQDLWLEIDEVNNLDGERQAGAALDARGFAGNIAVTGIEGGAAKFTQVIELDRGMQAGDTARVAINGHELVVTLESVEPGEATVTVNGETLLWPLGGDSVTAGDLAQGLAALLNGVFGFAADPSSDETTDAVVLSCLDAPLNISVALNDETIVVIDETQYDADSSTIEHSEISSLTLGSGDDHVEIGEGGSGGDLTHFDRYDLGDGDNLLAIGGNAYGTVISGAGDSIVGIHGSLGGSADVHFGEGENLLAAGGDIAGLATITFAGGDNTVAAANALSGFASVVFNGDGDNLVWIGGEDIADGTMDGYASVTFTGDGANVFQAGAVQGHASVDFADGDNAFLAGTLSGDASVTFGDGDNVLIGEDISQSATLTFGDGDNILNVAHDVRGDGTTITFGDGNNMAIVEGGIHRATLEFGDGENMLGVDDGLSLATVTFGDGGNVLETLDDVRRSEVSFGGGADTVMIDGEVHQSSIDLGEGDNTLIVADAVKHGSQVTFGAGADNFTLGDGQSSHVHMRSGETASVVDLGAGDDTATIVRGDNDVHTKDAIVHSGAFLRGGEGQDTLTVRAVDDVEQLVARTSKQVTTVTLDGDYTVGDVVSVTIGDDTFSYTVAAEDIVQGSAEDTRDNVARGLFCAINAVEGDDPDTVEVEGDITPALSSEREGNVIVLEGVRGAADVTVSAQNASVKVEQIANTGISGFETLNLVASNPLMGEDVEEVEDSNDDDHDAARIGVNFDLIEGVEQIHLTSEVAVRSREIAGEDVVNGTYTSNEAGDAAEFRLHNLPSGLGESITVSANEVTATGNRQVERITIGADDGDHAIGDVITVKIDDVEYSITVTAEDLAGADAQADAINIAARLAEVIGAGEHSFEVALDGNRITLVGSAEENVKTSFRSDGDDCMDRLQDAARSDDGQADVYVEALLAADADTDADTLELTLDGQGAFDLGLTAAGESGAYEHLVLDVQDEHSHTIDTGVDDGDEAFAGGSITLRGGAAGASIVIDDVMAKTVTSESSANVTVNFDEDADGGEDEDYVFSVNTMSGDDVVDMSGVTLTRHATIDLGEGVDRLVIGNGRAEAHAAAGGASEPDLDLDRMFKNVRNVEILQVEGDIYGEDSIVLDNDAFNAGFRELVISEDSRLDLQLGDEFERDLSVTAEDDVDLELDVHTGHAVSITAEDRLRADVLLASDSSGDFTLSGQDRIEVDVESRGSGAVDITVDEHGDIGVDQFGDGSVSVTGEDDSIVDITQRGLGNVAVNVGVASRVGVSFIGEDSEADVSIVQTGSLENEIVLEGLTEAQNVSVDIAVGGPLGVVADFSELSYGEDAIEHGTDLRVAESNGGIDTLTLRSLDGESPESVAIVTSDSWAVADDNLDAADMTIDASRISAQQYVAIDASNETDADLRILGSATSSNIVLGGAASDTIEGGSASDILVGDALARSQVTRIDFREYTPGESIVLTIGEDTLTLLFDNSEDVTTAEAVAQAAANWINGLGDDYDLNNPGNPANELADSITPIFFSTPTGEFSSVVCAEAVDGTLFLTGQLGISFDVALNEGTYEVAPVLAVDAEDDVTELRVDTLQEARELQAASDTLEGGEGDDTYVIAESQLDTMDTIVGLDLGGASGEDRGDLIYLGASDANRLIEDILGEDGPSEGLYIDTVVNGGEVVALEGENLDLASAVATLFEGDGVFDTDSVTSTHAAGLFSHQGETYLIAVGGDAGTSFGTDDYIVKVTGFTGTLDTSDFYYSVVI